MERLLAPCRRTALSPSHGLMLTACLLLATSRLHGEGEVIAVAVPVPDPPPAPVAPMPAIPPAPPPAAPPAPMPGAIQPVSYSSPAAPIPPYLMNDTPAPKNGPIAPALAVTPAPTPPASPVPPAPTPSAPRPPAPAPLQSPPAPLSGPGPSKAPMPQAIKPNNPNAAIVSVEVVTPERVVLGQPLNQEIVVRNTGTQPVAEVHVEEPLPNGVRALRCDPPAVTHDGRLTWDLRNLTPGGEQRLKVELRPRSAGPLDLRPYVSYLLGKTNETQVVRPPFSVELIANRESVSCNGQIVFSIRVVNNGSEPVHHVELYDKLPPGLHHPNGPIIRANLGDLAPGQMRTVTLETTAFQTGTFRNEVTARGDLGVEAKASLDVLVSEAKLLLNVKGPAQTDSLHAETFRIELSNPGSLPAKNVRLIQVLPPSFEVQSVSPEANLDTDQHALVWSLPDLNGGQRQTVTFRARAGAAGDWPLAATVLTRNLAETRAEHLLHVVSAPQLHLELRAGEEQLALNAETTYRIHLFNKGDASCTNLQVTATLPDAVLVLDAQSGALAPQIEQHQVHFAPLATLPPHSQATYRLRVRGRQLGRGSVHVELTADKQPALQRDLSIQVHGDAPAVEAASANSATGEGLR